MILPYSFTNFKTLFRLLLVKKPVGSPRAYKEAGFMKTKETNHATKHNSKFLLYPWFYWIQNPFF